MQAANCQQRAWQWAGWEDTPASIAPSKCYQGHGGPERGKRGEQERKTDFQPLDPKTRAGREKETPEVLEALTTAPPAATAENQFQAGTGWGPRPRHSTGEQDCCVLVQVLEQKSRSLEGSNAPEHMEKNTWEHRILRPRHHPFPHHPLSLPRGLR